MYDDEKATVDRRTFNQARLAIMLSIIGVAAVYVLGLAGWTAIGQALN